MTDSHHELVESTWQRLSFPAHWSDAEIRYWRDLQERFLEDGDVHALHTIWGMRREGRAVHPADVDLMSG